MGLFSRDKQPSSSPAWISLTDANQIEGLLAESETKPVLFFKHSTRCSISTMAKYRIETNWSLSEEEIIPVYLDLLAYRSMSDALAQKLEVMHQSPQVILVKSGKSIYNASHNSISVDAIKHQL